jgi:hypothetical protein
VDAHEREADAAVAAMIETYGSSRKEESDD